MTIRLNMMVLALGLSGMIITEASAQTTPKTEKKSETPPVAAPDTAKDKAKKKAQTLDATRKGKVQGQSNKHKARRLSQRIRAKQDAEYQKRQALKRFKNNFGLVEKKKSAYKNKADSTRPPFFVPTDKSPQLNASKTITCVWRPPPSDQPGLDGNNMRVQCDSKTKTCLVAEDMIFKVMPKTKDLPERVVPTRRRPDNLKYCRYGSPADFQQLKALGYTLKPARLDSPYGYKRDRLGSSLQTHFDLRSRLLLGVYYTGVLDGGDYNNTLSVETKSSYEDWDRYKQRRHRYRFIEGNLTLAPFTARATVFEYDYGRMGDDPLFFIGNMIGTPSRHDVHINLGVGLTLGRLDYQTINNQGVAFIDFFEGRINWELLQGLALEDYLMVRLGGGIGTRRYSDAEAGPIYIYPEAGLKAAWLLGERGLGQLSLDARIRYGYEPDTDASWNSAHANVSAEWIAITISDQPMALFVQPEYNYLNLKDGQNSLKQNDFRISAGIRLSMFVPTPIDPKKLRAKGSEQ